jgi:hypothetical protein
VSYHGRSSYLEEAFTNGWFERQVAGLGMEWKVKASRETWGDYSDTDVVLAIRSASEYDNTLKPPSKLINAWHARCLAICGKDPAFRQVGRPGIDYLEANSASEAVECLKWVRHHSGEAEKIRAKGIEQGGKHSIEAIRDKWVRVLWGDIDPVFRSSRQSGGAKHLYKVAKEACAQKLADKYFRWNI